MKLKQNSIILHLSSSAVIVVLAGIMYGGAPSKILPVFFDFSVEAIELKNIFRAIMGLYIGFGLYWMVAVWKSNLQEGAIISNMIFMGGIGLGRLISLMADGYSVQWTVAMIAELGYMAWAMYNLKLIKLKNG